MNTKLNTPTILTIPMKSIRSLTVLCLCNTGSRYEEPGKEGIAHFFEHMPAKGTKNYPSPQIFSETLDGIGAQFNAFTSKEYTGYYVQAASDHFDLALDVVSDMVMQPLLKQEDISLESGVIVEEINMYADMPSRHIGDLFEQMIYAETGLGHSILGSKETVTSFTSKDFETFLNQWYHVSNMVVVVAGDAAVVGRDDLKEQITAAFAKGDSSSRSTSHDQKNRWSPEGTVATNRLLVEHKATEQAHFIVGFPGLKRTHEERYALGLLVTLLGGNMSSRLFNELREKRGLCYYVHADKDAYHDTGFVGAVAGVDPRRVDEAVKVAREVLFAVGDGSQPVTQAELDRAKAYTKGKLVLGLEDSYSLANFYGMRQLLEGATLTPDELLQKLEAVEVEQVQTVAQKLIKHDQLRFGIIGPYQQDQFRWVVE